MSERERESERKRERKKKDTETITQSYPYNRLYELHRVILQTMANSTQTHLTLRSYWTQVAVTSKSRSDLG